MDAECSPRKILRVMTVGYRTRVSRVQSNLYMQDLDNLYKSCLAWSDDFMPNARWEYAGLLSGDIKSQDIPSYRAESLAYSTILCASSPGAITIG